jgi:hypothetical protein
MRLKAVELSFNMLESGSSKPALSFLHSADGAVSSCAQGRLHSSRLMPRPTPCVDPT